MLRDPKLAQDFSDRLREKGVLAAAFSFPVVPRGQDRGLAAGRAVASTCAACGRTWCPPRLGCCSRAGPVRWTTLTGAGRVVAGTCGGGTLPFGGGPAGEGLALIALDGADNLALGWDV